MNTIKETLEKNLSFWAQLSSVQKENLIKNSSVVHFKKGEPVQLYREQCIGVLILLEGTIRSYITSEEGREITLFQLKEGETCIFSASCVLQTIHFDVSVTAETECTAVQIGAPFFSRLSAENVYVELFSYKLATKRFSDVMWAMQQILFTSLDKRLASFLYKKTHDTDSDTLFMTHEQIARELGSAREVVSRMLKDFEKKGHVSLSRGKIQIKNEKKLLELMQASSSSKKR